MNRAIGPLSLYRADSLMAMGNFDETARELLRSPKVKNTIFLSTKSISCLVVVKLGYSIELRELQRFWCKKSLFLMKIVTYS